MPHPRTIAAALIASLVLGLAAWRLVPQPAAHEALPAGGARRVVSLSPAITEMVYAIGAGDKLVGVSDFCNYPPQARQLPRCGAQVNPNLERLTTLKPDLVLFQGQHDKVREFCDKTGQRCWAHLLDDIDDLLATMRALGELLGVSQPANAAADRLRDDLADLQAKVAGRPRTSVFVCIGRQPDRIANLTTCGPGTFLDEVLTLAGGANIFNDTVGLYPQPSVEALSQRQPEVVLDIQPGFGGDSDRERLRRAWLPLGSLPAVRNNRVHILLEDDVLIPGPRLGGVARRFARLLHPEIKGL